MKIYFDMEFTGLHKKTTPISIGMIAENGLYFYLEFTDYDWSQCDEWIRENVVKHLQYNVIPMFESGEKYEKTYNEDNNFSITGRGCKEVIREMLIDWFDQFETVELVSDVCHYDMVLLIDIFGHAFKMPNNVAPVCHDINQDIQRHYNISQIEAFDKNREEILREFNEDVLGKKHNALYDAKVIKKIYELLNK